MAKIYEIFGDNAHDMTMSLMEAANVAQMIPEGASVALKPNLVMAGTPESGATTHAGVLSGCIEYLPEFRSPWLQEPGRQRGIRTVRDQKDKGKGYADRGVLL